MSTDELTWFKSSYSGTQGDSCVEVAVTTAAVHVRDSKDLTRPAFTIDHTCWSHFVHYAAHT